MTVRQCPRLTRHSWPVLSLVGVLSASYTSFTLWWAAGVAGELVTKAGFVMVVCLWMGGFLLLTFSLFDPSSLI